MYYIIALLCHEVNSVNTSVVKVIRGTEGEKMYKLAVVGKMRSGKDTVASMLVKQGFETIAFADGITEIIENYFPEALQGAKPRKHYQHIGQELRKLNPNVWIDYLDRRINGLTDEDRFRFYLVNKVIVTDCRQLNEAKYLKENGFMIIKVEADEDLRVERMKQVGEIVTLDQLNHDTEKQVDLIVPDYVIDNSFTYEQLETRVGEMLEYYYSSFLPNQQFLRNRG